MECKHCGKTIDPNKKYGKGLFCNKSCQLKYAYESNKEVTNKKSGHTRTLKRTNVIKKCKKCGKEFSILRKLYNGKQIIPKKENSYCSRECANSIGGNSKKGKEFKTIKCVSCGEPIKVKKRSRKETLCKICMPTKAKIFYSINSKKISRYCKSCNSPISYSNKSGLCRSCFRDNIDYKLKLSARAKDRVRKGTHKGWRSRKILSYAEKFFIKVLRNNNLLDKCKTNAPIKKRDLGFNCDANYFLDFFFRNKNIDLEIDGKQHSYPDRIVSDKIRDDALTAYGIKVYRIKWKDLNKQENRDYMKNEIEKFLEFYHNL